MSTPTVRGYVLPWHGRPRMAVYRGAAKRTSSDFGLQCMIAVEKVV